MKLIWKNKNIPDCGIVAMYNVASWTNNKITYKKMEKIAKSCGYSQGGFYFFQFVNFIKKTRLPVKRFRPKDISHLESKLYSGKLLLILYTAIGTRNGHIITVLNDHNGNIKIINADKTRTTWCELKEDILSYNFKTFYVYEIPSRGLIKHNDVSRTD